MPRGLDYRDRCPTDRLATQLIEHLGIRRKVSSLGGIPIDDKEGETGIRTPGTLSRAVDSNHPIMVIESVESVDLDVHPAWVYIDCGLLLDPDRLRIHSQEHTLIHQ